MCGICGIVNMDREPVSSVYLRRMTDALVHRGPDGEGQYVDGNVGLGHRRLAILDVSPAGHQPMQTPGGQYTISYNGEVYNFKELRTELESLGHTFRSQSDTEVVLVSYVQWGARCVEKFNGMFALAIWDKNRRELFLARDRYGIKPLYYMLHNGCFLFASEQKALMGHAKMRREIDLEALLEYFTFQNIFTDRTLFKGVRLFPAGSRAVLKIDQAPEELQIEQYWDYDFREPDSPADEREYVEELQRLFKQAVNRQLVSDVEVCAYLSGGMDSGAITALAARQIPHIKTFTCGFDLSSASGMELGFDEREKSEQMSYIFGTEHYEVVLKAGDMERCLPKVAWHLEEPRVGQSYPNYYVAGLASKFGKVVLAGTGGDELFAGYPWRYHRITPVGSFDEYIDDYYRFWQRLIPNRDIHAVFSPIWSEVENVWTRDIFNNVFPASIAKPERPCDFVNRSLYFEAKTFLHGLFVVEDKLSMAHSLETRVPFMDNDLVDFAMQVPVGLKLDNLESVKRVNENEPGGSRKKYPSAKKAGKRILRKAMSDIIPSEVIERDKQGFSAPDASWFKGESIEYVRSILCEGNSPVYEYLEPETTRSLVVEHLEGKNNRRLLIWSLLNFDRWIRLYLNGESL